jgi:phospho-N-acetylmuramoyl-pentapeptide-transferase
MFGQFIREEGPQSHYKKAGTPTMGGLLILLTALVGLLGFLVFAPSLRDMSLFWVVLVLVVFGALGFSDDFLKITKRKNKGISGWTKLMVQMALGLILGLWVMQHPGGSDVHLPGHWVMAFGWLYPLLVVFLITGASNAYNLTDGLDGLAGGCGFMTFIGLAFLLSPHPSLMLFALLLAGGCLGFLVFNRHPAQIFMGDTGSLALGGAMAALAVLGKVEFYLLLLGGVYVIETLSVMLQVAYFKLTRGKRLFKMSPIHHHFELCGWQEPTVVITFILAQALLAVVAVLVYHRF